MGLDELWVQLHCPFEPRYRLPLKPFALVSQSKIEMELSNGGCPGDLFPVGFNSLIDLTSLKKGGSEEAIEPGVV